MEEDDTEPHVHARTSCPNWGETLGGTREAAGPAARAAQAADTSSWCPGLRGLLPFPHPQGLHLAPLGPTQLHDAGGAGYRVFSPLSHRVAVQSQRPRQGHTVPILNTSRSLPIVNNGTDTGANNSSHTLAGRHSRMGTAGLSELLSS